MNYPLSSVHKLIYEAIHPHNLTNTSQPIPDELWKHLKGEIEESRLHVFSQLSQATGTDCLKVIVYTCQAGYISLIKRITSYLSLQKQEKKDKAADCLSTASHYNEVRRTLILHLNDLYTSYHPFFDSDQKVPIFIFNSQQKQINQRLAGIRKQLFSLPAEERLINIVWTSLEQPSKHYQPHFTYQQLYYITLLLSELEAYCLTTRAYSGSLSLPDFLIRMNFNEPQFIAYITGQLREQITEEMTLHDQAEKWAFHVKEFQQSGSAVSYPLYPQLPSIKDALIHAAEQELQFIKQKLSLFPTTIRPTHPAQKERTDITTHLTVSQLGVFVRLLVDCNLIEHRNQTELLKLVARCMRTTKTAEISAESLRVRYYNPDRASVSITKEYLLRMIQQLGNY